jgi:hypothetical protein
MPECNTRTEILQATTSLTVGSVTLLPIERVVRQFASGDAHGWFLLAKEPHALVVRDAGGIRVVDTSAMPVSLDQLREKVPGLDAALACAVS